MSFLKKRYKPNFESWLAYVLRQVLEEIKKPMRKEMRFIRYRVQDLPNNKMGGVLKRYERAKLLIGKKTKGKTFC
jgi:hypothetical protein